MQSRYEMEISEAVGMVPVLREDYVAAAFVEPHSMDIDVHAIRHGHLKGIATRGGEVVTDAALTRLVRTQGSWVAETRAGAFAAPVVVNAAGAWCDAQPEEIDVALAVDLVHTATTLDVRRITHRRPGRLRNHDVPGDGARRDRTSHERPPAGRPHCARTHIRRSLPWPFAGDLIPFPADLFGPRSSTSSE